MQEPNQKRAAQTERAYRNQVREKLVDLLKVMNPQDTLQFGGMKYEELVVYARDWLNTEVVEVTPVKEEKTKMPAQKALGLDLD